MENTELKLNPDLNWEKLCKVGGISALVIVLIIPVQIIIFTLYPPPETTLGFFELFRNNWMMGLLSLDLLYYRIIPSTAGTLGLIFSLISLIPWIVFSVLIGRRLIQRAAVPVS